MYKGLVITDIKHKDMDLTDWINNSKVNTDFPKDKGNKTDIKSSDIRTSDIKNDDFRI